MSATWRIVSVAERPDLVPVVAEWLWDAFWQPNGHTLEELLEVIGSAASDPGLPESFVLLAGDVPCGTATLAASDLEPRPDIGPWLAGVYVVPEARGQGCGERLVAAVENAAREAGHGALYLYTHDAAGFYEKLGWLAIEETMDSRQLVTIMQKQL
ncbi:GNAT family N-acetyltransferase [Roseococcus sp. YIM B11640]|uniref:GNAT family N-acetyltransferase n=1 Tax=Roseococcus sp. YIM B11640 TaxID=3133973 RepID=UPI003C7C5F87